MSGSLDVDALVGSHNLTEAGESLNTAYYELDEDVLVAIPHEGSRDDAESAQSNADHQTAFFREKGKKGGIIIFFDRMTNQNRDARKIYESMDTTLTCTALVGGSMLTRAMASFFLGIARPKVPLKLFPDFDSAVAWVRSMNAKADRTFGKGAAA